MIIKSNAEERIKNIPEEKKSGKKVMPLHHEEKKPAINPKVMLHPTKQKQGKKISREILESLKEYPNYGSRKRTLAIRGRKGLDRSRVKSLRVQTSRTLDKGLY
jgi:uroporphyrinogen-III synthase